VGLIVTGITLIAGQARGEILKLAAPISFWGGVDAKTGRIIQADHPDHGMSVAGKILAAPGLIGSSSSSAVMLELLYIGKAPCALLLQEPDAILTLGVVVAQEMGYGSIPVLICGLDNIRSGQIAEIGYQSQVAIDT
jgi:predicted aconitase with swiveling domain